MPKDELHEGPWQIDVRMPMARSLLQLTHPTHHAQCKVRRRAAQLRDGEQHGADAERTGAKNGVKNGPGADPHEAPARQRASRRFPRPAFLFL